MSHTEAQINHAVEQLQKHYAAIAENAATVDGRMAGALLRDIMPIYVRWRVAQAGAPQDMVMAALKVAVSIVSDTVRESAERPMEAMDFCINGFGDLLEKSLQSGAAEKITLRKPDA